MELDELKKTWKTVDARLQKQTVTSDEQIANLIARHKANTRKSLGRITGMQRLSVAIGIIALVAVAIVCALITSLSDAPDLQGKAVAFLAFIALSILIGIWWDWIMDYHHKPAGAQVLLIIAFALFDVLIICLFYKKVMYKHLDNINKNIEELKDICTE